MIQPRTTKFKARATCDTTGLLAVREPLVWQDDGSLPGGGNFIGGTADPRYLVHFKTGELVALVPNEAEAKRRYLDKYRCNMRDLALDRSAW